jgi:hypothetical protein
MLLVRGWTVDLAAARVGWLHSCTCLLCLLRVRAQGGVQGCLCEGGGIMLVMLALSFSDQRLPMPHLNGKIFVACSRTEVLG